MPCAASLSLSLSQCQADACQPFLKTMLTCGDSAGWKAGAAGLMGHSMCCIPHAQPIASHTPCRRIPRPPPSRLALHVPHALLVTSHMPRQAMTTVVGEHDILQPPSTQSYPCCRRSSTKSSTQRTCSSSESLNGSSAFKMQWIDIPLAVALIPPLSSFLTGGVRLTKILIELVVQSSKTYFS